MNTLEDRVTKNVNSLIMMLRSKGVKQLSATKFLLFINNNYDVQLDQDSLEKILSNNDSVTEVIDDKIIIGAPSQESSEDVSDNIHDTAVDQASKNMSMESVDLSDVLKIYENIKIGSEINPKDIILESTDKNYFLNNGVKKSKSTYIITDILPGKTINESKIRCKINGQCLFADFPIKSIKMKKRT